MDNEPFGYIYCIYCKLNGLMYIGKTEKTPEKRFKDHVSSAKRCKDSCPHLHRAIRKYGPENFTVIQLEKVPISKLSEKEREYIHKLHTNENGFNISLGGDGRSVIDKSNVISVYKKIGTIKETAEILGICVDTVRSTLNNADVQRFERNNKIPVIASNKDGEKVFDSIAEAATFVRQTNPKAKEFHITEVCRGKRKTAYGYEWKYLDPNFKPKSTTVSRVRAENDYEELIFPSYKAAARWLIDEYLSKAKKPRKSLISAYVDSGKKLYGYLWYSCD